MCGTEVPVFLLLPGGSNIAGWRQQYCWLEAAIGDQPILFRQMPYAVLASDVNCTNNGKEQPRFRHISAGDKAPVWQSKVD